LLSFDSSFGLKVCLLAWEIDLRLAGIASGMGWFRDRSEYQDRVGSTPMMDATLLPITDRLHIDGKFRFLLIRAGHPPA
jgi:hypothetical protein